MRRRRSNIGKRRTSEKKERRTRRKMRRSKLPDYPSPHHA